MSQELIEIDGATLEGGGQILRMSIALSALLKKPLKIINIRAGRKNPGLRPQHLAGLELVRDITNGKLEGGFIGSTEISFYPQKIKSGQYYANPGTAGSIMLLFQVSFPCLLFSDGPTELELKGGTNAEMAPQVDHTLMVFKPIVENFGAKFECNIQRRGYFPKGGGIVHISVIPVNETMKPIEMLEPGAIVGITGRSFVAGTLPIKMAHGMAEAASQHLKKTFRKLPLEIERLKERPTDAVGNGSGLIIVAKTANGCLIGGSSLGKRGVLVEDVGIEAAQQIIEDVKSNGCVDHYMQDQLIIFMALAKGKSQLRTGPMTLHTKTAIFVVEQLTTVKFVIHENDQNCIIECDGIGLKR